jgi:hypothetical protein
MSLISLLGAALYYHPLTTVAVAGGILTIVFVAVRGRHRL